MNWLSSKSRAFTLVEIMLVVAIIAIIVSIAVPAFLRALENTRGRHCQQQLIQIKGAVDAYQLDHILEIGVAVPLQSLIDSGHLRRMPLCPSGGTYADPLVDHFPQCSIGTDSHPFIYHVVTNGYGPGLSGTIDRETFGTDPVPIDPAAVAAAQVENLNNQFAVQVTVSQYGYEIGRLDVEPDSALHQELIEALNN